MKVKSESEVAQSYPILSGPMDSSLLGSSTHGIFQARILEWSAIAFSNTVIDTVKLLKENIGRTVFDINQSIIFWSQLLE